MTDKKVMQLVTGKTPEMTPEFRKILDEMYAEVLTGKPDFILMLGDVDGNGVSFLTNLDVAGTNLLIDQVKLGLLSGNL